MKIADSVGYKSKYFEYYRGSLNGTLKRTSYHNTGIRFFVETKGVGTKLALDSIILELSLGVALLKVGLIVVDFLMLHIFPSNEILM